MDIRIYDFNSITLILKDRAPPFAIFLNRLPGPSDREMNLDSKMQTFPMLKSAQELSGSLQQADLVLVDCRSYQEYCAGHIPGSVNAYLFAYHWLDTTK